MSRQSNIKWRIQDERELAQVARDFNSKVSGLIRNNPDMKSVLPKFYNPLTQQLESEVAVTTLKSVISSRSDYKRVISMLKGFMKEGAEEIVDAPDNDYGTKTTRWHIETMNRLANTSNRRKKERLDKLKDVEMRLGKEGLGYTIGERFGMGTASKVQLSPTKPFTPSQSSIDINFKLSSLLKQNKSSYYKEKDEILKENFIREMKRNYNRSDVRDVIKTIRGMDNEKFVLMFEAHGDGMEMVYPPERGTPEYDANLEELKSYWLTEDEEPVTEE